MGNTNLKRLGDYIQEVSVKNSNLTVTQLMGISIDKFFMPSVANTIGTDLSNYKIVESGQFACNLMHVGRDKKIPSALNHGPVIIVSPAYFVFEASSSDIDAEYLNIVLRHPEFDRKAWFHTDGDVRGGMDKEGLMDLQIPVPSMDEQRKIVKRYKAIQNRINANKQLIWRLEDTAQTIYRNIFIEGVDIENLPNGWRYGKVIELIEGTKGGDWGKDQPEGNIQSKVTCIRGADIWNARLGDFSIAPVRYILEKNELSKKLISGDIVIEMSGGTPTQSTGRNVLITKEILSKVGRSAICSNFCKIIKPKTGYELYLSAVLKNYYSMGLYFKYENSSNGINNLDFDALSNEENVCIPSLKDILSFEKYIKPISDAVFLAGVENTYLNSLLDLIISSI